MLFQHSIADWERYNRADTRYGNGGTVLWAITITAHGRLVKASLAAYVAADQIANGPPSITITITIVLR
jgi:hypothetical protein